MIDYQLVPPTVTFATTNDRGLPFVDGVGRRQHTLVYEVDASTQYFCSPNPCNIMYNLCSFDT